MKRTLICTFVAVTSGLLGAYAGGQLSANYRSQPCQAYFWALNMACKSVVIPVAFWEGSTTGLGVGTILGAFLAGLATSKPSQPQEPQALADLKRREG